jgi:uncharacterized protein
MMRKMRRKDREIDSKEAITLLSQSDYGILSTIGKNGQPYGVPLNYVYKDNSLYFHCARTGHKLENIENNPKVSFCVVGETNILPADFSTEYESVIAFGVAWEAQGEERISALQWLIEKYSPDFIEEGKKYIEEKNNTTKVIKIEISHISGKAQR